MVNIEDNVKHEVAELICLKCLHRWIGVYPQDTPLKQLECTCGEVGYIIKTCQTLPEVEDADMENDIRYQNMLRMWGKDIAKEKYTSFIKGE